MYVAIGSTPHYVWARWTYLDPNIQPMVKRGFFSSSKSESYAQSLMAKPFHAVKRPLDTSLEVVVRGFQDFLRTTTFKPNLLSFMRIASGLRLKAWAIPWREAPPESSRLAQASTGPYFLLQLLLCVEFPALPPQLPIAYSRSNEQISRS